MKTKNRFCRFAYVLLALLMMLPLLATAVSAAPAPNETGDSPNNPIVCTTFASLKAALESEKTYVVLRRANDTLPTNPKNEHDTAISVMGLKLLTLEGESCFEDPNTGHNLYGTFFYVGEDARLMICGTGTLTCRLGAASTSMLTPTVVQSYGGLEVFGTPTLIGEATKPSCAAQVLDIIKGSAKIYGGTFIACSNRNDSGYVYAACRLRASTYSGICNASFQYREKNALTSSDGAGLYLQDKCSLDLYSATIQGFKCASATKSIYDYIEQGSLVQVHNETVIVTTNLEITSCAIDGIDPPRAGATPDLQASFTCVNKHGGTENASLGDYEVTLPEGGDVNCNVYWIKGTPDLSTYERPAFMNADETFEAGAVYTAFCYIETVGYLSTDPKIVITLNGKPASIFSTPAGINFCYATYTFTVPGDFSFSDVPADAYYKDAVDWAVAEGITAGTAPTAFSPDMVCTRAQAVTFLWRASGSPAPATTAMPFRDVPAGSYYYNAVLWAVEAGITAGTSADTFSPDMNCSRAQIVTMLWRMKGMNLVTVQNPFADVPGDIYYTDAVLWAVDNGVTAGTSSTAFSPDMNCNRAQIVTFIYRYRT